jgi:hypothetical protein
MNKLAVALMTPIFRAIYDAEVAWELVPISKINKNALLTPNFTLWNKLPDVGLSTW